VNISQDLRYGLRTLARSRAFAAAAIGTLTLAIAANTTMLGIIDNVLLRALPYRDAERLAMILESDGKGGLRLASYQTYLDWQRQLSPGTLSGIAYLRGNSGLLRTPDGTERVAFAAVTPGYFDVLGAQPMLGRGFLADEERGTTEDVAVLSYELWQTHYGGDRSVLGRTMDFDSTSLRIVGVMPPGTTWPDFVSFWRPLTGRIASDPALANRNFHVDSRVLGRLRPDVPLERALGAFRVVQARLAGEYPAESAGWLAADLIPLRRAIIGDVGPMLSLLGGGVFVVLLIACANVSNLSLVRTLGREREIAIRRALGATSGRIARQFLTESALLGLLAGAGGLLATAWAVRAIRASAPPNLPRVAELAMSWRVFGVALGLSLVATLVVGSIPVLRTRSRAFADPLRQGRHGGRGERTSRLRSVLSIGQLALAVALLVCGGLLVQSFRRIRNVDVGYDPARVLSFSLHPPSPQYDEAAAAAALYGRMLDALRALPGVESAALINHQPGSGGVPTRVVVPGRGEETRSADQASYRTVSGDYFRVMRIPIVRGRWYSDAEMRAPGDGIVISESVARRYWPGRDAIGESVTIFGSSQRRADFGKPQPSHVIGVAGDVKVFDASGPEANPDVYVPFTRMTWPGVSLVVRTTGDPEAMIPALKRVALAVDPAIPVTGSAAGGGFALLGRGFSQAFETRRHVTWLLVGFAASALLLALVGVYGVIAFGVSQRTQEFGVRLALGAAPVQLFAMVIRTGLWLALIGVAIGIGVALAVARVLASLLYNTAPADAATLVLVAVIVSTTVLLACAIPARRAARLDPLTALRDD
jgi:putative ABC transport system permease protein